MAKTVPARGVKKITPVIVTPDNLDKIKHLPGDTPLIAYKIVKADGVSHNRRLGKIIYKVGGTYYCNDPDTNPGEDCGAGLHVASLEWLKSDFKRSVGAIAFNDVLLTVAFTPEDIACIPYNHGKFRLKRLTVLKAETITWSNAYQRMQAVKERKARINANLRKLALQWQRRRNAAAAERRARKAAKR